MPWRQGWGEVCPHSCLPGPRPGKFHCCLPLPAVEVVLGASPSALTERWSPLEIFYLLFLIVGEDLALAPLCLSFPRCIQGGFV